MSVGADGDQDDLAYVDTLPEVSYVGKLIYSGICCKSFFLPMTNKRRKYTTSWLGS